MDAKIIGIMGETGSILVKYSDIIIGRYCIFKIIEKLAGAVSAIDNNGQLIGLLTKYNIRKHLEREEKMFSKKIEDVMNRKPIFVYEDEKPFLH